ncbi:MAG: DUF1573 domain-containing protein [Fibrobacter sp.]|nr:DUF1573 domain-containing protein [Fibrobacter sp.]
MSEKNRLLPLLLGLAFVPVSIFAGPMISIDNKDHDFGTVREGEIKEFIHVYKVKNTGDKDLIIKSIRPGCGCTAVAFDSVIAPGKEGNIEGKMKSSAVKGTFKKYITVNSNSEKDSILQLSLAGTIKEDLRVTPNYITIKKPSGNNAWKTTLTINTNKKDLKINEVSFVSHDQSNKGPSWQASLPVNFDYTLRKLDKQESDDYFAFNLDLSVMFAGESTTHGKFIIKTNHPKKPEVTINGFIESK